jgi:hypothetical protein
MMQTALAERQAVDLPLTTLIEDAAGTLSRARSAAEVLDARDKAAIAYDIAKRSARLAQAKDAHNTLVAAAHRAQARALEIEAGAKRRLADEYDAAQERGEVKTVGNVPRQNNKPSVADLGLSRKQIHEAREIRDAEQAEPGIVKRTLDAAVESGEEPTRAKVRRAVKSKHKQTRRPRGYRNQVTESQHDRDLRMLLGVWQAACETARDAFIKIITEEEAANG